MRAVSVGPGVGAIHFFSTPLVGAAYRLYTSLLTAPQHSRPTPAASCTLFHAREPKMVSMASVGTALKESFAANAGEVKALAQRASVR